MLYFELLPNELIEIIFLKLKNSSILLKDILIDNYTQFISNIKKCMYNPKDIFNYKTIYHFINNMDSDFLEYRDSTINLIVLSRYTGYYIRYIRTQDLIFNKFNGIKFNQDNHKELFNKIETNILDIKYIYLNISMYPNSTYIIGETNKKEYILIYKYESAMSKYYEVNIYKNWKLLWNNIKILQLENIILYMTGYETLVGNYFRIEENKNINI
jgi:hypothetical protein